MGKTLIFRIFRWDFGVWEGLQSIGNGCGLQMDGFSAHFEQYESILDDFHDFGHFGIVSVALTLFPEGPRTLRRCPKGAGTYLKVPGSSEKVLWWSDAASGMS